MKAREGVLISVKLGRQELQRYEAVQPGVFGFVTRHPSRRRRSFPRFDSARWLMREGGRGQSCVLMLGAGRMASQRGRRRWRGKFAFQLSFHFGDGRRWFLRDFAEVLGDFP